MNILRCIKASSQMAQVSTAVPLGEKGNFFSSLWKFKKKRSWNISASFSTKRRNRNTSKDARVQKIQDFFLPFSIFLLIDEKISISFRKFVKYEWRNKKQTKRDTRRNNKKWMRVELLHFAKIAQYYYSPQKRGALR